MDIMTFFEIEKCERRLKDLVQSPPADGEGMAEIIQTLPRDLKRYSEFTINPKPEYVRCLTDYDIKLKIEKHLRKFIETAYKYIAYHTDKPIETIREENNPRILLIGEHGKQGLCKLHYHGIIEGLANDIIGRYVQLCRRYIGRTELQMIRHEENYKVYMFKSYKEAHPETWAKHSYIKINWT